VDIWRSPFGGAGAAGDEMKPYTKPRKNEETTKRRVPLLARKTICGAKCMRHTPERGYSGLIRSIASRLKHSPSPPRSACRATRAARRSRGKTGTFWTLFVCPILTREVAITRSFCEGALAAETKRTNMGEKQRFENGRSSVASAQLNMAEVARMPAAGDRIAVAAKTRSFRRRA